MSLQSMAQLCAPPQSMGAPQELWPHSTQQFGLLQVILAKKLLHEVPLQTTLHVEAGPQVMSPAQERLLQLISHAPLPQVMVPPQDVPLQLTRQSPSPQVMAPVQAPPEQETVQSVPWEQSMWPMQARNPAQVTLQARPAGQLQPNAQSSSQTPFWQPLMQTAGQPTSGLDPSGGPSGMLSGAGGRSPAWSGCVPSLSGTSWCRSAGQASHGGWVSPCTG